MRNDDTKIRKEIEPNGAKNVQNGSSFASKNEIMQKI
jgi:hypothetical protein